MERNGKRGEDKMINEISSMVIPNWLNSNDFKFNINEVLTDSLYYPSCGSDGTPVKYFTGNVYSFIYVDYGISKNKLIEDINKNGFCGYHIIHNQSLTEKDLTPNGFNIHIPLERDESSFNPNFLKGWIKEPFCEWYIFERDVNKDEKIRPKRFSFLFLCAEGVASYQALYLSNKIKPRIIAIIQPGHGFGGNWTNFKDREKIFAKSVFYNVDLLPEYIINGGWGNSRFYENPIWTEYNKLIWSQHDFRTDDGLIMCDVFLRLWGKDKNDEK